MPNKKLQQFNNNSKTAFAFRLFLTLGLIAAIGFGAQYYFGFLNETKPRVARKQAKEQAATVDTLSVKFENTQPTIRNFGQVVTAKQLPLSTSVSGRVSYISENFKTGALVKAGELLLSLDNFDYRGNLMTANANLQDIDFKAKDIDNQVSATEINFKTTQELFTRAQTDYEGSVKLQKRGVISKQALDDKSLALVQQKQSLDSMSASFDNLKNQKAQILASAEVLQWAVDKAQKDLESTKIYAPFDAYIHNANIEIGQYISANSAIATLLDQQKIDVKFSLSDGQYGRIIAQDGTIIGRKIKAVWQLGQIEKTFDAVINRVNSEIVAASGGIDLYASIINVEAVEALRIGAFVQLHIPDQTYEQILKLPDYMIYDNDVVYVVSRLQPAKQSKPKPNKKKAAKAGKANADGKRKANAKKPQKGKKPDAELNENETRLEPIKIQIVGYDGDQILVKNTENATTPLQNGDALLQTRLSLAGKGVLVISSEQSAIKQAEALEKLKNRKTEDGNEGNNRFGRRPPNTLGAGGGGRGR